MPPTPRLYPQRWLSHPLVLSAAVLLASLWSLQVGAVDLGWSALWSAWSLGPAEAGQASGRILWEIRLPRLVLALLVGASLGVSGGCTQTLFRNPLAEPGLLGVTAGAALGAVGAIWVLDQAALRLPTQASVYLLPLLAFLGGLAVTSMLYSISRTRLGMRVETLLLAGVALNALAAALIGLVLYLADASSLRSIVYWQMGSLNGAHWGQVQLAAPVILAALGLLMLQSGGLNLLLLGEDNARQSGLRLQRLYRWVVVGVSLSVGAAIAYTGIIAFVGMVAPHLVRLLQGPDVRRLLPRAGLLGAFLLVAADTLARLVIPPAELPIGILTAALGAPFMLALVLRQRLSL